MYVISTGMICPVGFDAASACAAMRAGITMCEELSHSDKTGQPIIGASVPGLDRKVGREVQLTELLCSAVIECLDQGLEGPTGTIPILVGLSEPGRPGGNADLADRVIGQLEEVLKRRFHPHLSQVLTSGHTAGIEALAIARNLFRDSKISSCLVCGVDSYINASSLSWLDHHWRLKTPENSDGLVPGEAAAAVLLQYQSPSHRSPALKVRGIGFGRETADVLSEEPLMAEGLTEATLGALTEAGIAMHDIAFRLSDITGESYGFKEQALVAGRLLRVHRDEGWPIWHGAENVGDIGAAVGIGQLVVAFSAYQNAYAPGDLAICFTSAVPGHRAVAVLERTWD